MKRALLSWLCLLSGSLSAHEGGIMSSPKQGLSPSFNIVHTQVTVEGNTAIFHMAVVGKLGKSKPKVSGKLAGSSVFSYVWPTSLDSSLVGFESKAGILALAVTTHPDFDDTPLFDENNDGKLVNDGAQWHSHWVVLQPNEICGKGALRVVDIPPSTKPRLPKTWPGLPILIDSPGWQPVFDRDTLEVRVPFDSAIDLTGMRFDGVTAGLQVSANLHDPLLCVVNVFDIASGDLSLPGAVNTKKVSH